MSVHKLEQMSRIRPDPDESETLFFCPLSCPLTFVCAARYLRVLSGYLIRGNDICTTLRPLGTSKRANRAVTSDGRQESHAMLRKSESSGGRLQQNVIYRARSRKEEKNRR